MNSDNERYISWKRRKNRRKYKNRKIHRNNNSQLAYNNYTDIPPPLWLNKQLMSEIHFIDSYGFKDMIKKCKQCNNILVYLFIRSEDSNIDPNLCDKCYFSYPTGT